MTDQNPESFEISPHVDFADEVERVLAAREGCEGERFRLVLFALGGVPNVGDGADAGRFDSEDGWIARYEWTVASVGVANNALAFSAPDLVSHVGVDVRTYEGARRFFSEPLVRAKVAAMTRADASRAEVWAWATGYDDEINELALADDHAVMRELIEEDGDGWAQAWAYAQELAGVSS